MISSIFFEGILGISGDRLPLPNWVLPVSVIGIGLLVLVRGLTFRDHRGPAWARETGAPAPTMPADAQPAPEVESASPAEEPRTGT